MVIFKSQAYIVDWGFAVAGTSYTGEYNGTFHFASDSILNQLLTNGIHNIRSRQEDDLISLVRSFFAMKHTALLPELKGISQSVEHFNKSVPSVISLWDK